MPGLKMTDYKTAVATYVLREDGTYLIECGGWCWRCGDNKR